MKLLHATILATLLLTAPAWSQGMMGQGTMPGQGMMPSQGMMPGQGQGMMGQGQGMMHGRGMMQGQGMGRMSGQGMGRTGGIDRVEGRLAFLKAELKITNAQLPAWNAFAEAVRGNATTMHVEQRAMQGQVGTGVSLPDRVLAQANAFTAHAEEMMRFKAVLDPLYAGLSPEQKKTADEIVFSPMGVPIGMM